MQSILTHILSIIRSKKHPLSIWVKPRSQSFWYETTINHWDEEDWLKNMSNDAFNLLCNTLRPHILKEDTRFRKCIPDKIKLAATLYYLSGASDYRTINNLFGLDRSTACSIVHTVCKQIVRNLLKTDINLPKRDEARKENWFFLLSSKSLNKLCTGLQTFLYIIFAPLHEFLGFLKIPMSRSFSFCIICWMLNVFLVRHYKCVLLKQE